MTTATSSTRKLVQNYVDSGKFPTHKKGTSTKHLKDLVDPDKQSVPIDGRFQGFSFVQRSVLSPKGYSKKQFSPKVASSSPKESSWLKYQKNIDKNAQKRAELARLCLNLNKYLASPNKPNFKF